MNSLIPITNIMMIGGNEYDRFKLEWGKVMAQSNKNIDKVTAQRLIKQFPRFIKFHGTNDNVWIGLEQLKSNEVIILKLKNGLEFNLLDSNNYLRVIRFLMYIRISNLLNEKYGNRKWRKVNFSNICICNEDKMIYLIFDILISSIASMIKMDLKWYDKQSFTTWNIRCKMINGKKGNIANKNEVVKFNLFSSSVFFNQALFYKLVKYGYNLLSFYAQCKRCNRYDILYGFLKLVKKSNVGYRSAIMRMVTEGKISLVDLELFINGELGKIIDLMSKLKVVPLYMVSLLSKVDGGFRPLHIPCPLLWLLNEVIYLRVFSNMKNRLNEVNGNMSFVDLGLCNGISIDRLISLVDRYTISTDIKKAYDNIRLDNAILGWCTLMEDEGLLPILNRYVTFCYNSWPVYSLIQGCQFSPVLCTSFIKFKLISLNIVEPFNVAVYIDNVVITGSNSSMVLSQLSSVFNLKESFVLSECRNLRILGVWFDSDLKIYSTLSNWYNWLSNNKSNSNNWRLGSLSSLVSWQSSSSGKNSNDRNLYRILNRNELIE